MCFIYKWSRILDFQTNYIFGVCVSFIGCDFLKSTCTSLIKKYNLKSSVFGLSFSYFLFGFCVCIYRYSFTYIYSATSLLMQDINFINKLFFYSVYFEGRFTFWEYYIFQSLGLKIQLVNKYNKVWNLHLSSVIFLFMC